MALKKMIKIDSGNGLVPVQRQAIMWVNDNLSMRLLQIEFQWNFYQNVVSLIRENTFENFFS